MKTTDLPEVIIDKRAEMEWTGGSTYRGKPAKVLIGGVLFTSEPPIGAGHCESINRDIELLAKATP